MDIPALSQHENSLKFRAMRSKVLASNIANADTPNYKARDIEFGSALKRAASGMMNMTTTSALHKQSWQSGGSDFHTAYRVPQQPSLDGNTVETDVEQAKFAENALQYRASLAFLDGSIRSIKFAIKGGD